MGNPAFEQDVMPAVGAVMSDPSVQADLMGLENTIGTVAGMAMNAATVDAGADTWASDEAMLEQDMAAIEGEAMQDGYY